MYQVRSFDCFILCLRLPSLGLVAVLALNGLSRPCFLIVLAQQDGLVSLTSAPWWGVRLQLGIAEIVRCPMSRVT